MGSTARDLRSAAVVGLMVLAILCLLPSAWAANAICNPNWQWSYNSKGQNPCEVAASLQGPCFGEPNFELQQLQPGNFYPNPGKNTPLRKKCGCNTVIFSLYMVCTLCQSSDSTRTWANWSQSCDEVYVAQYPFGIPQNTTVPRWAYFDYTKGEVFNATLAQSIGRDPEAMPSPGSSTPNPSPTTTGPPNEGGSNNNTGAIAGGVVGGAAALLVIAALFFFVYKRRRKTRQAHVIDLDRVTEAQREALVIQDSHKLQRLYDPSDPSTFPPPVFVDGEGSEHSQTYLTPPHLGKYTGGAEV